MNNPEEIEYEGDEIIYQTILALKSNTSFDEVENMLPIYKELIDFVENYIPEEYEFENYQGEIEYQTLYLFSGDKHYDRFADLHEITLKLNDELIFHRKHLETNLVRDFFLRIEIKKENEKIILEVLHKNSQFEKIEYRSIKEDLVQVYNRDQLIISAPLSIIEQMEKQDLFFRFLPDQVEFVGLFNREGDLFHIQKLNETIDFSNLSQPTNFLPLSASQTISFLSWRIKRKLLIFSSRFFTRKK